MATFTWEVYSDTPGWKDISTNTIVFSGNATTITTPITVGSWQDGSHLGNGDPGTDQCGTNHVPNVKYVSNTQCDIGAGTIALSDAGVPTTECTLRIKFTDAASVALSSARFYAYDGSVETNEAVGIEAYAFERGVSATAWTMINDDTGNTGGDNTAERLGLSDQSASTEHTYYIAVSARPETVGAKTQFDFGIALTYS